jgi:hypothetical protein
MNTFTETSTLKKHIFKMIFEGTKELPSLEFVEDEGRLKIWGRSIATEARADFWQPLIDKLEEYLTDPRDMAVTIDLEFFATSSARALLTMFNLLTEKVIINKRKVIVKWLYEDEDMLEAGEDYMSMVPKLEWKFIEKE